MPNLLSNLQTLPEAEATFLRPVVERFVSQQNADNAAPMAQYLKKRFDFLGIKSPERRLIYKDFLKVPFDVNLELIARWLWDQPYRELQHYAIDILVKAAKKAPESRIDLYEKLISEKSWWDTVDALAVNAVGVHFRLYPHLISTKVNAWMQTENMWLQRTCLLFQLKYKMSMNVDLLLDCIKKLGHTKEFFIQKAIGWILREYSKTDANWVLGVVQNENLKPLSKREALKWLVRR
ncbi:MAG: DNA alkylation repair protein [Cyclobacteriaceae bacterium]